MKIVADNKIPFLQGVFEPFCDIEYIAGSKIDKVCLKEVDVLIIRTRTICNKELLEGTSVRFIATATIGFDHIDTAYCFNNSIKWVNAPGCNSGAVQQWFMAAILYYAKLKSINLSNKTLGVVGVGNVGKKIVKFAEIIGMSVLLNDPLREEKEGSCAFRSLQTVQRECDIITFHVPLIKSGDFKTFHMVNDEFVKKLSNKTILINSSRGEVLDNKVVNSCLESGSLEDVLLDVWENEPLINNDLLKNAVIVSPHIAGYSIEGKANGTSAVVSAVGEYLGLPIITWYPDEIYASNELHIMLDCEGKSLQDILTEIMLKTYSIFDDDNSLRSNIDKFELLRSNYKFRCEPLAWDVELINSKTEIKEALRQLGFKIH